MTQPTRPQTSQPDLTSEAESGGDWFDRLTRPWWAKLLAGLLMFFFAWSQYVDFAKLESGERTSLYVGRSTRILYEMGGKWLPTGLTILVGLFFIAWAIHQLSRRKA